MAFKSVEQYTEERYHSTFRLVDNGETADVIILYQSRADMLHADVHYVKSDNYSGYVHCLGKGNGCPVCALKRNDGSPLIRLQEKLFIPLYNIAKDRIEFWDRTWNNGFIAQLDREVFNIYSNPSEYVFKITREGEFNDKDTRYKFTAVGRNCVMSYEQILAKFQATMPEYYDNVVKSFSISELTTMLQSTQQSNPTSVDMPAYTPIPRSGYQSSIPDTYVNAADALGNSAPIPESDPILNEFDDEEDIATFEDISTEDTGTEESGTEEDDLATPNF